MFRVFGIFILIMLVCSCFNGEQTGDAIIIALAQSPPTLDVMMNSSIAGRAVALGNIYEKLIDEDMKPVLAEEWRISEDGKILSFKIRDGVKFHDGTTMAPNDVSSSLNRWLDSYGAASSVAGGSRFEVFSDYVYIISDNPIALLLPMISDSPQSAVVMRADDAAKPLVTEFIGTGPYMVEKIESGSSISLMAFDAYWGDGPKTKRLVYRIVPDSVTRRLGLETGLYDAADTIGNDDIPALKNNDDIVLIRGGVSGSLVLVFNKKEGIGTDREFRRNVSGIIDRGNIMGACYGSEGFVIDSAYMEGDVWKVSSSDPYSEKVPGLRGDGSTVRILSSNLSGIDSAAVALQSELEEAGYNAEIEIMDWVAFTERRKDSSAWDIFISAYTKTALPVQKAYLSEDLPGWFDDGGLLDRIYRAVSIDEAVCAWSDIQGELWKEVPVIVLGHYSTTYGIRKNITGVRMSEVFRFEGAFKE